MKILKSGTNISNKTLSIIFNLIIPVALSFLFFVDSVSGTDKILSIVFSFTFPETLFDTSYDNMKQDNSVEISQKLNSSVSATQSSTISNINIPSDIYKLIVDAEKKYSNSSNDGKIIEVDYSRQNATSEFNGIYLRNTTLNHKVNITDYINKKVFADVNKSQPSVLIYHTHGSESYELLDRGYYTNERSSISNNTQENVIRVGEEICKVLEKNGYKTIHDKTIYDEEYGGAYDRSYENVKKILKENPSIQVVLDIHRGTIYQKDGSRIKPVTAIGDRKNAQIQIISGCEDGNVTDFPDWEKNFTFALNLQKKLVDSNPTIARPVHLCSRKYNMDLMPCALQIEIGTDANTLLEAVCSAEIFAESLTALLKECEI